MKGKRFSLPGNRLTDLKEHAERKVLESSFESDVITEVAVEKLCPAPWNARRYFESEALQTLGEDMRENGQIHPILVRPKGSGFEIVVGERRYRAAARVGLGTLKAHIRDLDDATAQRISLAENLDREDLNPYEETLGYLQLLTLELKATPEFAAFQDQAEDEEAATRRLLYSLVGKQSRSVHNVMNASDLRPLLETVEGVFKATDKMTWQSFVKNRLPLLELPNDVLEALQEGKLAYTKATAIAKLKEEKARAELLEATLDGDLPLTEIRKRLRGLRQEVKEERDLPARASALAQALKRRDALKDDRTRRRVEKLLTELEGLLSDTLR